MTQTCKTCHEDPEICLYVGTDRRECEHPVRLSDVEPEPEAESPADDTLSDLAERVDLIAGQMQTMQMQWDDVWAAILKVRAGEGL